MVGYNQQNLLAKKWEVKKDYSAYMSDENYGFKTRFNSLKQLSEQFGLSHPFYIQDAFPS